MSKKNVIANRYEVIQHIGQGGMADVFRAVDTILNREVAIKILRSDLSTDAVSILRFEREAQAATALAHPNIVEVYDVGDYKGHHYIVMEYVRGQTLKQVIRNRGPLLIEEAVDIMMQLCSAVAEAHSRGIIHRDIKPQNVIIKADGMIKILDFGIATAKGSMQLTQANNVMGSVHYLAPELAKGETASPQSDIYAMGIVLFEMLAKDVPFKAEQAVQVALKQLRDPFPDIRQINVMVPQSVANIITRATAKRPEQRYRSADEMLMDLKTCMLPERALEPRLVIDEPAQKPAETTEVRKPEASPKNTTSRNEVNPSVRRNNRLLTTVVAILLSVVVVGGIFFALVSMGIVDFGEPEPLRVPDLESMTINQARSTLQEMGLDIDEVRYVLTTGTEMGLILSSDPEVGTEVQKGDVVDIVVSSGIGVTMRSFIGMKITEAQEILSRRNPEKRGDYDNITLDAVAEESDEPGGTIIRQELLEPNILYNPDTPMEIRLVYSQYSSVIIPEAIINMPVPEAVSYLEDMGVVVRTSNRDTTQMSPEELDAVQVGVVVDVTPGVNTEYIQKEDNFVVLYYY